MEFAVFIFIVIGVLLVGLIVSNIMQNTPEKKAERQRQLERERNRQKALELERIKKDEEWEALLENRKHEFGELTKVVKIRYQRENQIYVYEQSKILFIDGNKYAFSDILSCEVERIVIAGKVQEITTTPDKGEMATQEVLYGMGKKYNVKTTTKVVTTPEKVKYKVYIGLNSISTPQITFELSSGEVANEVKSLMNVIANNK